MLLKMFARLEVEEAVTGLLWKLDMSVADGPSRTLGLTVEVRRWRQRLLRFWLLLLTESGFSCRVNVACRCLEALANLHSFGTHTACGWAILSIFGWERPRPS